MHEGFGDDADCVILLILIETTLVCSFISFIKF